jgi:hypothetical protein
MPITPPFVVLRERRSLPPVKSSSAARKDFVKTESEDAVPQGKGGIMVLMAILQYGTLFA